MVNDLYRTDVSLYGIWDSNSLSFVNTEQIYFQHFVDDNSMIELMNKGFCVIWGTKTDGKFKILTRINTGLTPEEELMVHKKSLGNKFIVTGENVYLGSPEYVGYKEQEGLKEEYISKVDKMDPGTYSIDIYCLLRNDNGKLFLDYVVVINKVEDNHNFELINALPYLNYTPTSK